MHFEAPEEHGHVKLGDGTALSLRLVCLVIVITIWLIRLSDKVEEQGRRIQELAAKCRIRQTESPYDR